MKEKLKWSYTKDGSVDVGQDAGWVDQVEWGGSGLPVEITVCPNPPDFGDVTGGGIYANGEVVTVQATPRPGYRFINWTEGPCPGVTVNILGGNVMYQLGANETQYTHTFEAQADPSGTYRYEWNFGDGQTFSEIR